jgi:endonuclease/exonuclease/phosphatase family metal-dependent hydrolase
MTLFSRVYRRVIAGFLGRGDLLVDELPEAQRPSNLATLEGSPRDQTLGNEISILSYNIKRAERIDEVAASLVAAVDVFRPEVVLLQEAPPEFVEHAESVFRQRSVFYAPFHQVETPDRRYRFHRYGQIIATSVPMLHHEVIELPTVNASTLGEGHTMKRVALYVELSIRDGRIAGLINTHYEPFTYPKRRLPQYAAVLERLAERNTDVDLICGDLNPTLGRRSERGMSLLESLGYENAFASHRRTLDTCFAIGHTKILAAEMLEQRGSDHRPIIVRVLL